MALVRHPKPAKGHNEPTDTIPPSIPQSPPLVGDIIKMTYEKKRHVYPLYLYGIECTTANLVTTVKYKGDIITIRNYTDGAADVFISDFHKHEWLRELLDYSAKRNQLYYIGVEVSAAVFVDDQHTDWSRVFDVDKVLEERMHDAVKTTALKKFRDFLIHRNICILQEYISAAVCNLTVSPARGKFKCPTDNLHKIHRIGDHLYIGYPIDPAVLDMPVWKKVTAMTREAGLRILAGYTDIHEDYKAFQEGRLKKTL